MQYGELIADHVGSGVAVLRESVRNLDIRRDYMHLFQNLLSLVKKHYKWLAVLAVARIMFRVLFRSKSTGTKALKDKKKSAPKNSNDSDSSDDEPSNFIEDKIPAPARNQRIETDDVVVVNRNDRYVEVYSKKKI